MSTPTPLRRALYPLEYGAIRTALACLQALPLERSMALADRLGEVLYLVDGRHRQVAHDNLQAAFPELLPEQTTILARRMFQHMSRAAVELALVPRLITASSWHRRLEFDRLEHYWRLTRKGPALLVTGHIGNWELLGAALGVVGIRATSVARRLENPLLDRYCLRMRQWHGQRIIYKERPLAALGGLIRQGENLAFAIDQDAGSRGIFCSFLGRAASTTTMPALLARRLGVPIIPGFCLRNGSSFSFHVRVGEPILPQSYDTLPAAEAVARMTQEATRQLEAIVLEYPEQWLWMHRRWKTRPPEDCDAALSAPPSRRPAALPPVGASEPGARGPARVSGRLPRGSRQRVHPRTA